MQTEFTTLEEAIPVLRELSKQFICPQDRFFGPLADAIEKRITPPVGKDSDDDSGSA